MRDPRINRIMGSNSGLFGTRQFFCGFDSSQVRDSCAVLPKSGDLQTAMKHVNLHVTGFFVILVYVRGLRMLCMITSIKMDNM